MWLKALEETSSKWNILSKGGSKLKVSKVKNGLLSSKRPPGFEHIYKSVCE